jgi:hypothetical protein
MLAAREKKSIRLYKNYSEEICGVVVRAIYEDGLHLFKDSV